MRIGIAPRRHAAVATLARVRAVLHWTALATPVVALGITGWAHRLLVDDGFIYLRVVSQIRAGNGPVFNAGQRVEAFTSPAWLAILSMGSVFPVRVEHVAVALGLAFSLLGVALALLGARRSFCADEPDAPLIPVGALAFVAVFPVWVYATSGLETGLTFAWQGLSLWLLARWASSREGEVSAIGAFSLGLGWLIRPEMLIFSVFFAILLASNWRVDKGRGRARLFVLMFALPLSYQIFRMGYYGSLVANSAIAKESSLARWDEGWRYFRDFVDPYRLWLPMAGLAVGAYLPAMATLRRSRNLRGLLVIGAFALAGLLNALYVVRVGGDWMHARLLLPALFALCAPVALVPIARRYLAAFVVIPWALVSGISLRPDPDQMTPGGVSGRVTLEQVFFWTPDAASVFGSGPGLYYQAYDPYEYRFVDVPAAPGVHLPTMALTAIGAMGYALGPSADVQDLYGLADALAGHLELGKRGLPGHEKTVPAHWTVARLTAQSANVFPRAFPNGWSRYPGTQGLDPAQFARQVESARAALRCGAIHQLEQAVRGPLTVGRFFANLWNSYDNTKLRIPADANEAYRRFCLLRAPRAGRSSGGAARARGRRPGPRSRRRGSSPRAGPGGARPRGSGGCGPGRRR